ncbi:HNH endonuclease [Micromonospora eburnea]|uniref:HNH endonuclease n=1 Tax=Micromonospora eburnea TaxID=227316 RepID=A0A1C6TPQ6_9ACTN|nr:HNH endonuclease [Micromonospora eburnea]SCL43812.1 HNH endonuclease [Micromonospora eburnea]SCL43986.1 HNH endonuclease [Micromonospora eburnea]
MWLRIDDKLITSVKIRGLVDDGATGVRATEQRCATIGHWLQIVTWVAGAGTDGFVPADVVDEYGTKATTARLLRARYGRAPLLHVRNPDGTTPACPCLDGRTWHADYAYAVHDYLDRNPSRSENDVHRAKKRELRDAKLKRQVRDRDRDRCRYCGRLCKHSDRITDEGMTFDHVDPEVAAGMDNLVVACRGCNNRKNRRTPEQADMVLLPVPTTDQTNDGTYDGPTTEPATVAGPVTGAVACPVTGVRADLRPDQGRSQERTSPGRDGAGIVTGSSTRLGPPDTVRPAGRASPYLRPRVPKAGHPPDVPRPGMDEP